jgi:hypothetical protein
MSDNTSTPSPVSGSASNMVIAKLVIDTDYEAP